MINKIGGFFFKINFSFVGLIFITSLLIKILLLIFCVLFFGGVVWVGGESIVGVLDGFVFNV